MRGSGPEGKCKERLLGFVSRVRLTSLLVSFFSRYDVYTPTQNIVYHNYQANPDGHGPMEWLKPRFERFRQGGLKRIRSYLELPNGLEGYNLANLGIYGLGKRRSLRDMAAFLKIDMETQSSRPETVRATPFVLGLLSPHTELWHSLCPSFYHCRFHAGMTIGCHTIVTFLQ
jgi:hypothetical protein